MGISWIAVFVELAAGLFEAVRGGDGPHTLCESGRQGFCRGRVSFEFLGELQRVGDPALALLVAVGDVLEPEFFAVAEQLEEVPCMVTAGDDEDVADPRMDELLDGVVDHGPIVDRQEVFVRDPGHREESGAESTGEDDPLHRSHPPSAAALTVRPAATKFG